jgi:methionine-rich copper-binding protein CopC
MEIGMRSGFAAALIASLALGLAAPALAHTAMTKKLVSSSGQQIQLDYKPTPAMSKTFTLALPKLSAGKYTLSWRAVAKDGHAMPGAVHFSIAG